MKIFLAVLIYFLLLSTPLLASAEVEGRAEGEAGDKKQGQESEAESENFEPSPAARFEMAQNAQKEERYKEALEHINAVLEAYPTWSKAHIERAAILAELPEADPVEIKNSLDKAEWAEGNTPRFHYLKGRYFERAGKPQKALAAYEKSLELRASFEEARMAKEALEKRLQEPPALAVSPKEEPPPKEEKALAVAPAPPKKEEPPHTTPAPKQKKEETPPTAKKAAPEEPAEKKITALLPEEFKATPPKPPIEAEPDKRELAERLFEEGKKLMAKNNYIEAKERFREALELFPSWGIVSLELAVAHFLTDYDLNEIGRRLLSARGPESRNPRLHYWLARYYEAVGMEEEALQEYEKAIELRKGILDAQERMESLKVIMGKLKGEGKQGSDKKRLDKGNAFADPTEEALALHFGANLAPIFERAKEAETALTSGKKRLEEGEIEAAALAFREASALLPWWPLPRVELARIYLYSHRDIERARRELSFAAQANPFNAEAFYLLAVADLFEEKTESAISHLANALEIDPSHIDALLSLARIREKRKEYEAALELYKRASLKNKRVVEPGLSMAAIYEETKRYEKAEEEWLKLVKANPENPALLRGISSFYERRGEKEKAKSYAKQAAELKEKPAERKLRPLEDSKDIRQKKNDKR